MTWAGAMNAANPMPLNSRRPRPLERTIEVRDARLVVIASEGERTEPDYFDSLRSTRIKIRTIPCPDGRSSPVDVLIRMREFKDEYELEDNDELWLVIDRDRWSIRNLGLVARECLASRINLAVSNPCFEVWLALHYTPHIPPDLTSKAAPGFFSSLHGPYKKNALEAQRMLPLIPNAINNAAALDANKKARWPHSVGTRVYILMANLLPFLE